MIANLESKGTTNSCSTALFRAHFLAYIKTEDPGHIKRLNDLIEGKEEGKEEGKDLGKDLGKEEG